MNNYFERKNESHNLIFEKKIIYFWVDENEEYKHFFSD